MADRSGRHRARARWWRGAVLRHAADVHRDLQMYVIAQPVEDVTSAFQGAQLAEERVKSYTKLATSPRVLTAVVTRLRLSTTPERLALQITATGETDAVIIDLAATDRSAERAAAIADATADALAEVVGELERSSVPAGVSPVSVRVVQAASIPTAPSSIGLTRLLVIGLFAGLVTVSPQRWSNALDTSITSLEHLRDATGAPNLGWVVQDGSVKKRPLIVHDDPQSSRAEVFRQLRTNLQSVDIDNPSKVVVVTSALPARARRPRSSTLRSPSVPQAARCS